MNTCDLGLFPLILGTLIPFLLGLATGWFLWGKLKTKINELLSQNKKLSSDFDRAHSESTEWASKFKLKESELNSSANKLSSANLDISKYRGQAEQRTSERDQYKLDLNTVQSSLTALQSSGGSNKKDLESLTANLASSKKMSDDWSSKFSSSQKEMEEIKSALNKANETNKKINSELSDAKGKLSAVATDSSSADELNLMTAQNTKLGEELSELQSALEDRDGRILHLDKSILETERLAELASAAMITAAVTETPIQKDDLTKIEGIGSKTKELLYNAGIYSFEDLANTGTSKIDGILTDAGSRFQLLNPGTWSKQSRMAADGNWDELKKWQDYLDGGVEPTVIVLSDEDMSAAADVFGRKIKLDDLTLVEGIGPKISSLLNEAGVATWRDLSTTDNKFIVDLLEKNGLGFHTPATWPKQAELAADGKWSALLKWQDELDGGK